MSKAFTKDDAWEEPIVAPRAPLPPGAPNYVTPRGLEKLRSELASLEATVRHLDATRGDEDEERRQRAILGQRLSELVARIASAQLVEPHRQAHDKVRFGATVTVRDASGVTPAVERRLQIVGVDEADPGAGTVAFTAPIARAILGCAVGDVAILETADGEQQLEIVALEYTTT